MWNRGPRAVGDGFLARDRAADRRPPLHPAPGKTGGGSVWIATKCRICWGFVDLGAALGCDPRTDLVLAVLAGFTGETLGDRQ